MIDKQKPVAWLCQRPGSSDKFVYTEEQLEQIGYGNISLPDFIKIAPLYMNPCQCEKPRKF